MNSEVKKAGLKCKKCGSELLVIEEHVICQNKECMKNGKLKKIIPN